MAVYGTQGDLLLNKGAKLYVPGKTVLAKGDVYLGGTGTGVTDEMIGEGTRIYGNTAEDTAKAWADYQPVYNMQTAIDSQLKTQTDLINKNAEDQATKIRQAIASQALQGEATKTDYSNQMNAAIGTMNAEKAKIPGQITNLNNSASSQGVVNAQKIRSALSQMGLLQSGESASQQLLNDTTVANNTNANNLQGQELQSMYGTKVATAQTDLASKVKQINDAIALAQSQGDENALSALSNAQASIADAGARSAVDYNNWAYTYGRDAVADRNVQQTAEAKAIQDAIEMLYQKSKDEEAASRWEREFAVNQANEAARIAVSRQNANRTSSTPTQTEKGNNATADAIEAIQRDAPNMTRAEFDAAMASLKPTFIRDGADPRMIQEVIDSIQTRDEIKQKQATNETATNAQAWKALPLWERLKRGTMFN